MLWHLPAGRKTPQHSSDSSRSESGHYCSQTESMPRSSIGRSACLGLFRLVLSLYGLLQRQCASCLLPIMRTCAPSSARLLHSHVTACAQPPQACPAARCNGGDGVTASATRRAATQVTCAKECIQVQPFRQHVKHAAAHCVQGQALLLQWQVLKRLQAGATRQGAESAHGHQHALL